MTHKIYQKIESHESLKLKCRKERQIDTNLLKNMSNEKYLFNSLGGFAN